MRRVHRPDRGFILIEPMIVVTIIDILAVIALPACFNYVAKSHATAGATQRGRSSAARSRAVPTSRVRL